MYPLINLLVSKVVVLSTFTLRHNRRPQHPIHTKHHEHDCQHTSGNLLTFGQTLVPLLNWQQVTAHSEFNVIFHEACSTLSRAVTPVSALLELPMLTSIPCDCSWLLSFSI